MNTKILLKLIEDMLKATGKKSAKEITEINKKFIEELEKP